ncbi:NAD(P)-binding protein [Melanomma pulvis-pyrius CBS 109.77]|uniref:NAD(P)-binding protein n=1 Tax=Melanomma pulvis-pyrius CBS 109.77 TaxID=1314802 RepID=A0A6A6WZC4_9PLEO|nr:NAD(P)-binding protein [Melanomma pulvis-pyrius CBS 109.77]
MTLTIGIAGITGKFGRTLATHLLSLPSTTIRGLSRSPSTLPPSLATSPRITLLQGAASDPAAARALAKGCDVVVCCYLGPNALMTNAQKLLVDACAAERVPRYIPSDYCLDFTRLAYGQLPAKDPMKDVMAYVEATPNVAGVHVLIGVLMETWWSRVFGVWDPEAPALRFWGDGDDEWECTTYGDAAAFVAQVAVDEGAVGVMKFVGDRKSTREIAQIFESVYHVKPALESRGSLEDLYKRMHEVRDEDPAAAINYMPMFYNYYCSNGQTHLGADLDNEKYPDVKAVTFEGFLKANRMEDLWGAKEKVGSSV